DPDIFISRRNELAEQLRAAKLEKGRFLESEEDQTIQRTQELIEALEAGPDFLDAFDGELFREPVDKIIVGSNDRLRFRLVNGLELTEPIERTVR
ncbi:MAG: recombinase family protein, partial [Flavonifractor plautii]